MRTRLPVKFKVAVVTAALTFVILCLFAAVVGAVAERRVSGGFEDDLRATAADLQDRIALEQNSDGSYALSDDDQELLRGVASGGATVRVLDLRGRVYFESSARELGPPIDGVVDAGDFRVVSRQIVVPARTQSGPFEDLQRPVVPIGWVQYARAERSVQATINRVRVFLALGVLGGTGLAFLGGLVVARRAMRPISGLTRAAREVARTRDPDVRLPKPLANDEVSDLAHTLEDMLGELSAARGETEATLSRQREFVADASHELRTPLTSILANLELLESELAGEQRDMAASALRSSLRMRRLVTDLLVLARADARRESPRTPVDLARIAHEAASEAESLAVEHSVTVDAPDPVTIEGVADDLHRMVGNLVENALLHTPAGTPVTISVRREGDQALVEVADRGPGVPHAMRERVFERFARGEGDSARSGGGSGLGLAIVRAVSSAHGGSVELGDAEGGGARFRVMLPATSRTERPATVLTPREPIPDP